MGIYPDPDHVELVNMPRVLSADEFREEMYRRSLSGWKAAYGEQEAPTPDEEGMPHCEKDTSAVVERDGDTQTPKSGT